MKIAEFKSLAETARKSALLKIEHPKYTHMAQLQPDVLKALRKDFA